MAALAFAVIAGLVSTSGSTGCGKFCDGGFIRGTNPGTCEGLCAPSKCANPGNVCVDNKCALECKSQLDCGGGQDCVAATDDAKKATAICKVNNKSAIGAKCPFGNECDSQLACPDGSACGGPGCTMDKCQPLHCLSNGVGDADAYCTLQDCHADGDCPGGYWCEAVRDPHKICGGAAQPIPQLCGKTTDPCVMPGSGGAGPTYAAGPFCTMRNQCRLRKLCDPCASDLDCSAIPGLHCTMVGSAKACTKDCASDSDCSDGFQCTSNACVPRAGSCTGMGNFCEPCHNDTECGAGKYCARETSGEERICVSPLGSVPCTSDSACPTSPSGKHGLCMDARVNVSASDPIYHTCWLPYIAATSRFGCWCGNKGTACNVNGECCSKKCTGADPATMTAGACD